MTVQRSDGIHVDTSDLGELSQLAAPKAESFAQTVNQLKGKVTLLFIAHQLPRGLKVDEVLQFGRGRRGS